ncbi:MAG: NAD(P)/FAD-dependent oxidoreductase [Acidimicrobiales bacterium]
MHDVAIVGAGVVGCAVARGLARYRVSCVVVDRAGDVGAGTSKANTAILHTGFDTEPGTLESTLVRRGHALLADYAGRAGIALERTGALLVAWDAAQADQLDPILDKARRNGYHAAYRIDEDELRGREPHIGPGATGALVIPDEWLICPWSTTIAYATEALGAGVEFRLGTNVTSVAAGAGHWTLATTGGPIEAHWVVNAAGLASGAVDRWFGHDGFTVAPRRGQLIVFDKLARSLVSSILLPVPTARTKGVLVAPTVYGNILLGPTAEDIADPADTATTADGLAALLDAGHRIVPELRDEEVTATYAGVRAATEHRDYQIEVHPAERYACIGGIRSTGLTASLAIAEYVAAELAAAGLHLEERDREPTTPRVPDLGEAGTRSYQRAELVAGDPAYGHLVCFCERVTEGDIRDAMSGPLPATDVAGLRRRTRATNGRCQAFYCGAHVASLLAAGAGR